MCPKCDSRHTLEVGFCHTSSWIPYGIVQRITETRKYCTCWRPYLYILVWDPEYELFVME
jgi:hypothetical protein